MNILVIGDIHSDIENLMVMLDKIALLDFDVIVYSGDFVDIAINLKGATFDDITRLVLEELKGLKKPIVAVPGNHDKEVLHVLEENGVSIHGTGKIIDGVGFYGYGGARTPFGTPLEPSEEEIEDGLEKAYDKVKNCKIKVQVTHMPPARTKLDTISSGAHVGSEVVRKFIEEKKPAVAISAHIHEARSVDEFGETKLINTGRYPEGYCGLVTIDADKVTTKIINLI